jgi:hypothetical protein
MPSYKEMENIAIDRARLAGLDSGTPIIFDEKRTGVFVRVNPLFFDRNPMMIYVHLEAGGRFKAKRNELVSMDKCVSI